MTSVLTTPSIPAQRIPTLPPIAEGGWFDIILSQSSDHTQRPVVDPLSSSDQLFSDIAFGEGTENSKTHRAQPAKLVLSGIPGRCAISIFAGSSSKPIGEKRVLSTSACVIFLRELTTVLPAGTRLKLQICPIP